MRHWFAKSEAFAVSAEPNRTRPHLFGLESIRGPCRFGWGVEALVATFPSVESPADGLLQHLPMRAQTRPPQRGHFGKVPRLELSLCPPCHPRPARSAAPMCRFLDRVKTDSNVLGPLRGPECVDEVLYRVPRLGEGRSRCCLVLSWLSVLVQARHTCAPNWT